MGLFSKKEYKGTLRWEYGPAKAQRTKIPGGWLFYASDEFRTGGSGVTFIPDPEHKWNGNSK